tara:strand:- start:340 stop:510 length:171 start_codon:yes stop_codon:yes gene_type:complete
MPFACQRTSAENGIALLQLGLAQSRCVPAQQAAERGERGSASKDIDRLLRPYSIAL